MNLYGAKNSFGKPVDAAMQEELQGLSHDPPDAATATLRQQLRQRGTPIGPYGLQLAGTALARQRAMVTHPLGGFGRVEG